MAAKTNTSVLVINGLDVKVTRKRIKNLRLRVTPHNGGSVEVSAPYGTSDAFVRSFVVEKKSWIEASLAKLADSPSAQAESASKAEIAEWKNIVAAATPLLVEHWEKIMGVKVGKLAYRNMKSRWGSCQPSTGRICINIRLALYPPECLEYVVVHELCHLIERGHGPKFYALMDKFLPDWKTRKAKLR